MKQSTSRGDRTTPPNMPRSCRVLLAGRPGLGKRLYSSAPGLLWLLMMKLHALFTRWSQASPFEPRRHTKEGVGRVVVVTRRGGELLRVARRPWRCGGAHGLEQRTEHYR